MPEITAVRLEDTIEVMTSPGKFRQAFSKQAETLQNEPKIDLEFSLSTVHQPILLSDDRLVRI